MGRLVFTAICSLDGYVVDAGGDFGWAAPDAEVHAHVNDGERGVGTFLLGRRMYDVLSYWGHPDEEADREPVMRDYRQLWQAADKIVYSRTLTEASTARTTLRTAFDRQEVHELKQAAVRDLSVGGPTLAAATFATGLVDEVRLYRHPVVVGGGTSALPHGMRVPLETVETVTFRAGVVFTRHRVRH